MQRKHNMKLILKKYGTNESMLFTRQQSINMHG